MENSVGQEDRERAQFLKQRTGYFLLLAVTVVFIVVSVCISEYESLMLSIPTLVLAVAYLIKRGGLFVPPLLVIIMAVVMVLMQVTMIGARDFPHMDDAADIIMGMFLCLIGLIMVYTMMRSLPGQDQKRSGFVGATAFCIGVSLSTFVLLANFFLEKYSPVHGPEDIDAFAMDILFATLGSAFVTLLFILNYRNGLFRHTLEKFLTMNADTLGIAEQEREQILEIARGGETSRVEFKSTLKTNLATGEKDPRMENAVLKTIVAFLNTRGGTLLIGVSDDGEVIGMDSQEFDSKDKIMLHMNNLIKSQIGSVFIPYINYRLFDFDDKVVMRVDCSRSDVPAFLHTTKKDQVFYVRSGPSSIDLHGTDLLAYAANNYGRALKRIQR